MRYRLRSLLQVWCDGLLARQEPDGGFGCPSCARVHGRSGDAIYPLLYIAHRSGSERHLEAAIRLQAWSDCMSCPDGSWVDDPGDAWKGITVFGALALAESVRLHGEALPADARERWTARLARAAAFLDAFVTIDTGNINYPATACAALAAASCVLREPRYRDRARDLFQEVRLHVSPNGLLFGEGRPRSGVTPRGCSAVNIGYNVEESIPALALYGHLTGDAEATSLAVLLAKSHLDFLLPDGSWDNSFGTRDFKWTYWGSRTSDGCQPGYVLLARHDPRFMEAARRNLGLLEACTHEGLLYGGPDVHHHGEPACIHHTFCHAKALAASLDYMGPIAAEDVVLPRESVRGTKHYPEIATWLVAEGSYRATITAYDWVYQAGCRHPSGGTVSLLWHPRTGPILAGSLTEYVLVEPGNMARDRVPSEPLTLRVETRQDGVFYRNINDDRAGVSCDPPSLFRVRAHLVDMDGRDPRAGPIEIETVYQIDADGLLIRLERAAGATESLHLVIPLIAAMGCRAAPKCSFVHGASEGLVPAGEGIYNHVPGLEARPVRVTWDGRAPLTARICVKP